MWCRVNVKRCPFSGRFWRQVGGHLRLIECNNRGIVWGIGYDHTAWVYTGGYGGGFIQGMDSWSTAVYTFLTYLPDWVSYSSCFSCPSFSL